MRILDRLAEHGVRRDRAARRGRVVRMGRAAPFAITAVVAAWITAGALEARASGGEADAVRIGGTSHGARVGSGPVGSASATDRTSFSCASPSFAGYPLFVSRVGGTTTVYWDSGGHNVFDLVRGSLNVLAGDCNHDAVVGDCTGGNFRNALNAISPASDICMANDTITTYRVDARIDPPASGGEFYLTRQTEGCGESDSYNDGTEVADRDPGIFAANGTCP